MFSKKKRKKRKKTFVFRILRLQSSAYRLAPRIIQVLGTKIQFKRGFLSEIRIFSVIQIWQKKRVSLQEDFFYVR